MVTQDGAVRFETNASGASIAAANATYFGLSTDDKPESGVGNGSCFIEMDTGKLYFFDEDDASWIEWGASL